MNDSLNKIKAAFLSVLLDLLSSKKAIVAIGAVVVMIAGHYGFALPSEDATKIAGLAAAYVIGQGVADHGKEAALISSQSVTPKVVSLNVDSGTIVKAVVDDYANNGATRVAILSDSKSREDVNK